MNVFIPFIIATTIVFTISNIIGNINIVTFVLLGLIYSVIYIVLYLCISATDFELSNIKKMINYVKR